MTALSLAIMLVCWAVAAALLLLARRRMSRHVRAQLEVIRSGTFQEVWPAAEDLTHGGVYSLPRWLQVLLLERAERVHGPRIITEALARVTGKPAS